MKPTAGTAKKTLLSPITVQRNHKVLIEGYENIRENQGKLNNISLKMSGKIREFFTQIVVATLLIQLYSLSTDSDIRKN